MKSVYLESALNGFILTHVQGLNELLDLILTAPILSLPSGQLLPLLCEVGVLVQRLLVHMAASISPVAWVFELHLSVTLVSSLLDA